MSQAPINHDRLVDQVWTRSLQKIMKGDGPPPLRREIGDEIDALIPQVATGMLLAVNPAFAKVLYATAQSSAKRNAFFAMRRLGMPSDFFWKFDMWSDDKALSTITKVVDRIFKAVLQVNQQGLLTFNSVDVPNTRFEITFADCAECHGVNAGLSACYFHAGTFAGIFSAMLDTELECFENTCVAAGAGQCSFTIGLPNDREVAVPFERNMNNVNVSIVHQSRFDPAQQATRRLVDIGYYQLLLSSAIAGNLATLSETCFATGVEVGTQLGSVLESRPSGVSHDSIAAIYAELRYLELSFEVSPSSTMVTAIGAPETMGALVKGAFVPFLAGELESLLKTGGFDVSYSTAERENGELKLVFVPQI